MFNTIQGADWLTQINNNFSLLAFQGYGKVYYVDNVAGLASNGGTSWQDAMAQINAAITAGELWRLAQTNPYTRYAIYVRGTANAYAAITAMPNYCDIIGIGADPRGNGSGIVSISGAGIADACAGAGRGVGLYNLQFTGSGAFYSLNLSILFRSVIQNCAFVNCANGARIVTGGGNTIRNCQFGGDTTTPTVGLAVGTSAGNWNQCLMEYNCFYGSTTGFSNGAYLSDGTVFRFNTCYGGTTGILDTSTQTGLAGSAFYVGNWASGGANGMSLAQNAAARNLGNAVVNNVTGARGASGT